VALVRSRGLEPPRLAALTPQASASTNSATTARGRGIGRTSSKLEGREQAAPDRGVAPLLGRHQRPIRWPTHARPAGGPRAVGRRLRRPRFPQRMLRAPLVPLARVLLHKPRQLSGGAPGPPHPAQMARGWPGAGPSWAGICRLMRGSGRYPRRWLDDPDRA
jgi:hypothetical protein